MLKRTLAALLVAGLTATCGGISADDIHGAEPTRQEEVSKAADTTTSVEPGTPEERAAALGLPAPPELDIDSWEFLIANSYNMIKGYQTEWGSLEGQLVDVRAKDAASAFINGAREAGFTVYFSAIYRNFEWQETWYHNNVLYSGRPASEVSMEFLPAGCSEHQLGLALDFTDTPLHRNDYNMYEDPEFKDTELYSWLCGHCTEYGFILRYAEGKEEYYGGTCSHAHFRYVGEQAAKYISENGLCLEEFVLLYDPDAIFVP